MPEKSRLERDSYPDLCNAGTELFQLRYQANWELIVVWVHDKAVDSEDSEYIFIYL